MPWEKLGHIFKPIGSMPWMTSHATHPVAELIEGMRYRIFFTCRDQNNRSHVGSIVINLERPSEILQCSEEPDLAPGNTGYFDDSGCQASSLQSLPDGHAYLYYLGWNLCRTVPWRNSIGLAIRRPGSTQFEKYSLAPIMDRSSVDPLTLSYPWVIAIQNEWQMWYGSHQSWKHDNFEMLHVLRRAESNDGINWVRSDATVLPLNLEQGEFAMSRPCVIRQSDRYRMWFSARSPQYKMGYAESVDGLTWERDDARGALYPSSEKTRFDSESVEYASVFESAGNIFMLYNGNNYGETGFGLALWLP